MYKGIFVDEGEHHNGCNVRIDRESDSEKFLTEKVFNLSNDENTNTELKNISSFEGNIIV